MSSSREVFVIKYSRKVIFTTNCKSREVILAKDRSREVFTIIKFSSREVFVIKYFRKVAFTTNYKSREVFFFLVKSSRLANGGEICVWRLVPWNS